MSKYYYLFINFLYLQVNDACITNLKLLLINMRLVSVRRAPRAPRLAPRFSGFDRLGAPLAFNNLAIGFGFVIKSDKIRFDPIIIKFI